MTYSAYDEDDYVGDVASIGGWASFSHWAQQQGGAVAALVEQGFIRDPAALAGQLEKVWAPDRDAESVRMNLLALARKAKGLFLISDGVG